MTKWLKTMTAIVIAAFAIYCFASEADRVSKINGDEISGNVDVVTDVDLSGLTTSDGSARPLPKYLHSIEFSDTYQDEAKRFYVEHGGGFAFGSCSARRSGDLFERNYDWFYDDAAEFVVHMKGGEGRAASVGVASLGTNITESIATSGKWSPIYKALPGMTLDGVNEHGVAACINVVSSHGATNGWHGTELHCLGAVRWVLDSATNALHGAQHLAENVYVPQSILDAGYSFHYAVVDAEGGTYVVEDGDYRRASERDTLVITNYRIIPRDDPYGTGYERYDILAAGGSLTNAWFREAYRRPFSRPTEFAAPGVGTHSETNALIAWAEANIPQGAPESLARGGGSWQTVHSSIYDLSKRTLRVAVQETDDWYSFSLPAYFREEKEVDAYTKAETDELLSSKLEKSDVVAPSSATETGKAADALEVKNALSGKLDKADVIPPSDATESGKAADAFSTKTAITNLDSAIATKQPILTAGENIAITGSVISATVGAHGHSIADITNLQASLDSKAKLIGGNIFYNDQWVANGDLNLVGAGFYVDRSGIGQEYIDGRWNGDYWAFMGTKRFLILNGLDFSSATGAQVPTIDGVNIATVNNVSLKLDKADVVAPSSATNSGKAADALATKTALAEKQPMLTAGDNITITGSVISASAPQAGPFVKSADGTFYRTDETIRFNGEMTRFNNGELHYGTEGHYGDESHLGPEYHYGGFFWRGGDYDESQDSTHFDLENGYGSCHLRLLQNLPVEFFLRSTTYSSEPEAVLKLDSDGNLCINSSPIVTLGAMTNFYTKAESDALISQTNPAFSNAVLAVGLDIDTNTVAAINELVEQGSELPVTGATTVGGLLLALAAALAALKKRVAAKVDNTGGEISGVVDIQDWLAVGNEGGGNQITGIFIRGSETGSPGNVVIMGDGEVYLAGTFEDAKNGNFNEHYGNIYDIENIIKKLDITKLAPVFSVATRYSVGDFCSRNGTIYQCVVNTQGVWISTKWSERNLSSLFSDDNGKLISTIETKVNAMFDNGETTDYPRTTGEG